MIATAHRYSAPPAGRRRENGFTLLELLVAVLLVMMAFTMIYATFTTVTKSWRMGNELAEDLHHGDFVMDQLVMGLRSTYYPDAAGRVVDYGFILEDTGAGENSADSISWVKRGYAFTATNSPTVAGPHRLKFSMEDNGDGDLAPAVRFWRPYALPEDFDYEKDVDAELISGRVRGFNCRVATNMIDGEWEWEDTWEDECTNRLPLAVELTLYLEPLEEDGECIKMMRFVEIPVAHLSWKLPLPPKTEDK
jgi:hypothetical protein